MQIVIIVVGFILLSIGAYNFVPFDEPTTLNKILSNFVFIGMLVIVIGCLYVNIPAGHTGVITRSKFTIPSTHITTGEVVGTGNYFNIPFYREFVDVNNQPQSVIFNQRVSGTTTENIKVSTLDSSVVIFQIPSEHSVQVCTITKNMKKLIPKNYVSSAVNLAISELSLEEAIKKDPIEDLAVEKLNIELAKLYGEGAVIVSAIDLGQIEVFR